MKFCLILLLSIVFGVSQGQKRGDIRIMFYNVENLFDTKDDPATDDQEFTPYGNKHWNRDKYEHKLQNLYKVIAGVGTWQAPEIAGFAEVENRQVLSDLITTTPLSKVAYKIAHFDSPDPRGIDVGLIYRSDKLRLIKQAPVTISFKNDPKRKTRDILYVQFSLQNDTIHVFINHWPSRRAGEQATETLRIQVASILRQKVDSLQKRNQQSKIIIMGDFNDEPADVSINRHLKASGSVQGNDNFTLHNLSSHWLKNSPTGTHSYRGQWGVLDQIIVSGGLIRSKNLYTTTSSAHIFSEPYLLQTDSRNLTKKPFPTFAGFKYLGGYSDHLPVYLDLFIKK